MSKKNKLQIKAKGSIERVKKYMTAKGGLYSPDRIIEDFASEMDKNKGKELTPKLCQDYQKVAMTLGLDTHLPVVDSVSEEYRTFLMNTIREIEYEYDCKTSIEKAQAEVIALSHTRIIYYSKLLDGYIIKETVADKEKTDFYNLIGKELDRAHRQFSNAILTLKQLKAPSTPFKVTAKTAFFAQNQQINNNEA